MEPRPLKVHRVTKDSIAVKRLRVVIDTGMLTVDMEGEDVKNLDALFKPFSMSTLRTCWNTYK